MTEREKEILKILVSTVPKLSELDKERLLAFCEGVAFKTEMQQKSESVALALNSVLTGSS